MANNFFVTVTIPPVPSSDAGMVLTRTLRVMQAGTPTIDTELALDAVQHGFDAEEAAKLHLELVDKLTGTSKERAMRELTVGEPIAAAKPGELEVTARPSMFAVSKPVTQAIKAEDAKVEAPKAAAGKSEAPEAHTKKHGHGKH